METGRERAGVSEFNLASGSTSVSEHRGSFAVDDGASANEEGMAAAAAAAASVVYATPCQLLSVQLRTGANVGGGAHDRTKPKPNPQPK